MNSEPPSLHKYRNTKPKSTNPNSVCEQWGTVFTPFPDPYYGERTKCPDYNLTVEAYWACRKNTAKQGTQHHGECCSLDIVEDMAKHDCGSGNPFIWRGRCYFVAHTHPNKMTKKCKGKRTRFNQAGFDKIRQKYPQQLNSWHNYCMIAWDYIDEWCVCD